MAYSTNTIGAAIESMYTRKLLQGNQKTGALFVWEETPGRLPDVLVNRRTADRGPSSPLHDLTEYCWRVYDKAFRASGRQFIGRTGDLWNSRMLLKFGLVDQDIVDARERATQAGRPPRKDLDGGQLTKLWEGQTAGNIQVMDKWSPIVNDAWVLGGVHRLAEFELVSPQAPGNLWDVNAGFHIVTARELLGLRRFGYLGAQQPNGHTVFTCADPVLAQIATLQDYAKLMTEAGSLGALSVTSLIQEIMPGLNEEIRSFDRTRLRSTGLRR